MQRKIDLELDSSQQLRLLCGELNANLNYIASRLNLSISNRGNTFLVSGDDSGRIASACDLLQQLAQQVRRNQSPNLEQLHLSTHSYEQLDPEDCLLLATPRLAIKVRSKNQLSYIKGINANPVQFGVGPAGTGKSFLAVAAAVVALQEGLVERIVLVRPAVEAGEKLGFLPGDLQQKINPYLQPLYDALYAMYGRSQSMKLQEQGDIEIAPLAYMRGRTLTRSFIILDEGQNTTIEQMKMFLTRIGYGSRAVVTGDDSQIDLPNSTSSGLVHALKILAKVRGIGITRFASGDIVRHSIVQRIVEAYDNPPGHDTPSQPKAR